MNAQEWIHDTVASVLRQPGKPAQSVEVTYIVHDGGSTDATVHRAQEAVDTFASHSSRVEIISERDSGMYDALARGFARIEELGGADWYAYLNAGDLWTPQCLSVISRINAEPRIDWLMGLHTYFAPDGMVVHTRLPFRYRRALLRHGAYGRGLPTVQQESTFWRGSLHSLIDTARLPGFRVAGDSFLWWSLARGSEPFIIEASLGGFRYHGNHLGVSKAEYSTEMAGFAGEIPLSVRAQIPAERALWEQPARAKARMNPRLLKFETTTHGWGSANGSIRIGGT